MKDHKFAIVDEDRWVVVRTFQTENAAQSALKFWGKNTDKFLIFPIDGATFNDQRSAA